MIFNEENILKIFLKVLVKIFEILAYSNVQFDIFCIKLYKLLCQNGKLTFPKMFKNIRI